MPQMLSEEDALLAYAAMINTLDERKLAPLLADDFHYASQWVLPEMTSKDEFLTYITEKFATIRAAPDHGVWAEMATMTGRPCVLLSQETKDQLIAYVVAETNGDRIVRFDMCAVPDPRTAAQSGRYPN